MALCLVGKAGKGRIWAGFLPVISQEAPIPLAPCSQAAQSNRANPTPTVLFFSQAGLSSSPPVLLLLHHLSRCRFLSMSKKSIFSILRAKMFHSSLCQSNKKPRDFEELLLPRMRATTIQSRYLKHTEESSKNTLSFFPNTQIPRSKCYSVVAHLLF